MRSDPDPAVASAALAAGLASLLDAPLTPALADSIHGTRAILGVLSAPSATRLCKREYEHFGPIYMTRFLPAAIERASPEDLVPALDLLLAHAPPVIYHCGWGPQLRAKMFPAGIPLDGPLTVPQQALRDVIARRCFGPDSPPLHHEDDARKALNDLVP